MAVVQLLLGARRTCQQSACVSPCGVGAAAAFPRLARNTAHARELREKYDAGEIEREEYEREESLEKNRISNISVSGCRRLLRRQTLISPTDGQ